MTEELQNFYFLHKNYKSLWQLDFKYSDRPPMLQTNISVYYYMLQLKYVTQGLKTRCLLLPS